MDPYQKIEGILSKAGFIGFYVFFLRPDRLGESALSNTGLYCPLYFVSGLNQAGEVSSQDIRRLLADRMRTQAMSKLRGESPHPLLLQPPKSFPEGLFLTMPVIGHPSFEESYPSLANQSSAQGQAG